MSQPSEELAGKASSQLEEIIAFLRELRQEDLEKPDPDRPGKNLASAAAHMAEGYHFLGRFLEAQLSSPEASPSKHVHGRPAPLHLPHILNRAVEARNAVADVADVALEQLGDVPAAGSSRFSDGRRTVEEIIEAVIAHQAQHLDDLRSAVRGPAAASAGSQE